MYSAKQLLTTLILTLVSVAPTSIFAAPAPTPQFVEGKDYIRLPNSVRNNQDVAALIKQDPQKAQVLFFFSYGCPACNRFDAPFESWLKTHKSKHLAVYRFPMVFEDIWGPLAKLYYTMEELAPKTQFDAKIFNAIHKQNLKLWQESAMKDFAKKSGYNANDFDTVYNSYNVKLKVEHSDHISKAYGVSRTPSIVINGANASYILTTDRVNGDLDKFLKILDYLLKKDS